MKEVITFFGAEPKVGTTMIAQSVAEELTSRKIRSLLIFASSEMHDDFLKEDDSHASLDDLLNIDPDELKLSNVQRVITKAGGMEYIKGSARPLKIRYFSEKLIPKIVELLDYDYIIIDGGSNYHYPLPISSLLAATKTYYVLTQDAKAVSRFSSTMSIILKAPALKTKSKKSLIINKFSKNDGVYTPEMLKDMFDMDAFCITRVAGSATCEANRNTLSKVNRQYKANIVELVNQITSGGGGNDK